MFEFLLISNTVLKSKLISWHVKYRNVTNEVYILQLFSGEEHAFIFLTYYEAEMWELRVCSIASNIKYFV